MKDKLEIYCDGGARGNPGAAASAIVVIENGKVIFKEGKYIGKTTNNVAEYQAVVIALDWLLSQDISQLSEVIFYLDSELVVKQINGQYKVKSKNLILQITKVLELKRKIKANIVFENVPREKNKLADLLVNETLDKEA